MEHRKNFKMLRESELLISQRIENERIRRIDELDHRQKESVIH